MKTANLIVSKCYFDRKNGYRLGDRLFSATFGSVEEAMKRAADCCLPGVAVTVRPNYNEKDERGRFFREWRSFNGGALEEIRFPRSF